MGVFTGTTEGNIALAIERWLTATDYPVAINDNGRFECDEIAMQDIYEQMDAENWLKATDNSKDVFCAICQHEPHQMFMLAFSLVLLRRNVEAMKMMEIEG